MIWIFFTIGIAIGFALGIIVIAYIVESGDKRKAKLDIMGDERRTKVGRENRNIAI